MNTRNLVAAVILFLLIIAGGAYYWFENSNLSQPNIEEDKNVKTTSDQEMAALPTLDLSGVENLEASKKATRVFMNTNLFYKADWRNIVRVDVDGEDLYIGSLERSYGNGKPEQSPMPVFLWRGNLYTPAGYGGNPYPTDETDWIWKYKNLSLEHYEPLERYATHFDMEEVLSLKMKTEIDKIYLGLEKSGAPTRVEVTKGEKIHVFNAPFERYRDIAFVTIPELKDKPDYNSYHEESRRLAGNVSSTTEYVADTGYKIKYPAVMNGKKVTRINEGRNNQYYDSFHLEDRQVNPDTAYIICYENDQQQVGPKSDALIPVAPESRSEVKNWGYRKEYHGDTFSFTGPGFHCQVIVSEAFTPEMFTISF